MSDNQLYRINENKNPFTVVLQCFWLFFSLVISFWVGTQFIAWKTDRAGFYEPFSSLIWAFKAKVSGESTDVYIQGMVISFVSMIVTYLLVYSFSFIFRSRIKQSDIHGSAQWANEQNLKEAGLINNDKGLYIGGWENKRKNCIEYLRDDSPSHLILIAPPRSGKGVGIVTPNLLTWPGSVIVFDLKGENFHLTSGYRKEVLNNYVFAFDPTNNDGKGARFNPLNEVRMGINEFKDTQQAIEMMIDPNKKSDTDHWRRSAVSLLVGAVLHNLYARKDKTLTGVVNLLSDPRRPVYEVLESMLLTEHDPDGKFNWEDPTTKKPTKHHPIVSSIAREFKNKSFDEMSSIVSTALAYLTLYRDPIIAKNTSESDFTISDIIQSDKPVSLYIIVPPSDIQRMVPLTRLLINQISTRLMENKNLVMHDSVNSSHPLLMMLDEFHSLGRMENLKDSLSYMAGYGIRVCLIVQDLDQIYELYGEKNPILSYCKIRIAHATNSDITARRISSLAGETTLVKFSKSYSDSSANVNESASEIKRSLLLPDEIMRLNKEDMLIFVENLDPILGKKIVYYQDPVFKKMASYKPVGESDRLKTKNDFLALKDVVEYQKSDAKEPKVYSGSKGEYTKVVDDHKNETEENW
jgi:type IV secretion system protein VirD4